MVRIKGDQGFVLLVTLWVLVMLSVILTTLAYQVRVEAAVERWTLNQSTLRWAARGAVHLAAARIREHATDDQHSPTADWWSSEKLYRDQPLGQARVSLLRPGEDDKPAGRHSGYGLDDEESRLNINVARPEHLMAFAGISSVLAEDIVLFRLKLEEKQGQAKPEQQEPEEPERVQGPIRSLRELLQVDGVTEKLLFEKREDRPALTELLTTVSSGKVNINSASETVLTALGLDEGQVNTILASRKETPYASVDELQAALGPDQDPEKWQRLQKIIDVRSSTFRLLARAQLPNQDRVYHVEATLSSGAAALAFIRWQEY